MSYVNDELNLIHIHVPKTGGTSVRTTLNRLSPTRMRMAHNTAAVTRLHVGIDLWPRYFSFGFVRNPWDLLVSFHRAVYAHQDFERFVSQPRIPFLRSQKDYFFDEDGWQLVNYIGRFETLEKDFEVACRCAAIEVPLLRCNEGLHPPYQECYTPALRDYVGERFEEDVKFFEYAFD